VAQKDQPDVISLEDLGYSYLQQQKTKEGLANFEKAMAAGSKNKDVYFQVGNGKFKDNNFSGAVEAYNKAITLDVNDEVIYNNRGKAKASLGDTQGALADYDKA